MQVHTDNQKDTATTVLGSSAIAPSTWLVFVTPMWKNLDHLKTCVYEIILV